MVNLCDEFYTTSEMGLRSVTLSFSNPLVTLRMYVTDIDFLIYEWIRIQGVVTSKLQRHRTELNEHVSKRAWQYMPTHVYHSTMTSSPGISSLKRVIARKFSHTADWWLPSNGDFFPPSNSMNPKVFELQRIIKLSHFDYGVTKSSSTSSVIVDVSNSWSVATVN